MNTKEREKKTQSDAKKSVKTLMSVMLKALATVMNIVLTLLLILVIAGVIVVCAFAIYLSDNIENEVDEIITLSSNSDSITSIYYYDEDGNLVEDESQRLSSGTNRLWVPYYEIPEDLSNAFVAIEDKRFWDHNGVDWLTTIQATLKYFIPVGSNPGGSTITQQLVKNLTGDDDYSIQRKVTEIFRAMDLEEVKTKEEILEMYMNTIYLSQGANGVQAAANVYFSKDVSELTLLECAAIAGITQYPTKWDPVQNPENNKLRRNIILTEMLSQGMITQSEYDEAYDAELVLNVNYESISLGTTSWYTDAVISDALEMLMETYGVSEELAKQMLYSGGYDIVTAMDPEIQQVLENYYEDVSENSILPVNEVIMPESAMIVADPATGNILGLVGGRGEKTESRIYNRATMAKRQAGSSFKPIAVYAQALELGIINGGSVLDDTPYNFGTEKVNANGTITYSNPKGWPKNSNNKYQGRMNVDYALTASKNPFAVKVLDMLGVNESFEFLTEKLHFTTLVESSTVNGVVSTDKNLASLALGGLTYGVTLREMVAAYTIFPTDGVYTELRTVLKILDSEGNVVVDNTVNKEIVISESTAQIMNTILQHVITKSSGTAYSYMKPIRNLLDVAGKTGTTDSNNDRWFIGYSPYYVCGVWIGYDEPQSLSSVLKNGEHCRAWCSVMVDIHQEILDEVAAGNATLKEFNENSFIKATYCADSGMLITDTCNMDPRGSRAETGYFTKDTLPTKACNVHVLVPYCTEGEGVACDNCPAECIEYVALLNIKRDFARDVYVTDAQYTWRDLPDTVAPYTKSTKFPFYYSMYSGTYPGRTSSSTGQYNKACSKHQ